MILIILFSLIGLSIGDNSFIKNKTKLIERKYTSSVSFKNKIIIRFYSENLVPFSLIIYTLDGIPLIFKGKDITYVGKITYFEIKNLGNIPNNLIITFHHQKINLFDILLIITSLCSICILIFYKRDHRTTQIFLFILLIVKIYNTSDYKKVSDNIIHKILF